MGVPANIEVFNQVVAKTFVRLYEAFPRPVDLDPVSIGLDVILEEPYEPDSPEYAALVESVGYAIQFLIDESFIRLTGGSGDLSFRGFSGAVLTSKGFGLMQETPDSIDEAADRRTYFQRLKDATMSGMKTAASETIGAVVARLLTGV